MRRRRISRRPATVSKRHALPALTIGIGRGHSPLPVINVAFFAFFGSVATTSFSRAVAANSVAWILSRTVSSVTTRSIPSGPRIAFRASTSNVSAADTRASAAASAEGNVFWAGVVDSAGAQEEEQEEGAEETGEEGEGGSRFHGSHLSASFRRRHRGRRRPGCRLRSWRLRASCSIRALLPL